MSESTRSKKKTQKLFKRIIQRVLRPAEILTVSKWAEKYRILDDSSNIGGRWSNNVTPYLVEIMDCMNNTDIRKIFFCKSTQVGGTAAMINMLFYIIMQSPAPTMIVYPSDDLAKDISNDNLKPALKLIPNIKRNFMESKSKELKLKFKNMNIYLRGAGSPSKLASKPIKYLFYDEIDKMGGASKKEASPYNLALERTKTYRPQEKVYACSTPTLKTNYIWELHDSADEVKHYFVKCPHCKELIELKFKQIIFAKDDEKKMSNYERAQTAVYCCQECGCEILDSDKPKMLREGKWQVIKKRGVGKAKSVGYWINSLYSIFLKWSDIIEEFLNSHKDPEKLQNFTNSWLAEPWEDTQLKTSSGLVMKRQADELEGVVPEWASFITGGVDVQKGSMYYTIRAWGKGMTSQNITHGQVISWQDIEKVMNRVYKSTSGRTYTVALALVDSGNDTDDVYDFCANNSDWAIPVKGSSHAMTSHYKISIINRTTSKAHGMRLILVDTDKYKDMIAGRMRRENGTGSWLVYKGCDERYASQVTAEHKVSIKTQGGRKIEKWVLKTSHADNHYLDTEVYSFAAADMIGARYIDDDEEEIETVVEERNEDNWISGGEDWI